MRDKHKLRVVFLRSNPINPDPRVEKELRALVGSGVDCFCLGWDRSADHDPIKVIRGAGNVAFEVISIGVESPFGSGVKNLPRTARFESALYSWLVKNSEQYDAVHACDLDTGIVARAAQRKTGKPYVYDIFDFFSDSRIMPDWLKGFVKSWEFSVIRDAWATIICTEQRKTQLEGSNPKEIVVIENTPEEVEVKLLPRTDVNAARIAYVGVLTSDRFLDRLLDAIDDYDDLVLDIGGFGPLASVIEERSKTNPRIIFHGKVPYETALELEKSSDIMLGLYNPAIPNNRLAAPNKYYESLMLGTPLLAVRGTSVGDWVESEETGYALNSDFTPEDFYLGVCDLVKRNKNGDMSRRQIAIYRKEHSWAVMAQRLCAIYDNLRLKMCGGA